MSYTIEGALEKLEDAGIANIDAAIVLGSGWSPLLETLGEPIVRKPYDAVGLRPVTAPGHVGEVALIESDGYRYLVFSGRTHLFEGHGTPAVALNVRVAARLGAKVLVLTNANGSLFKDWELGTIMAVSDHINLTGTSPVEGANFVDLTDLYDAKLRADIVERAKEMAGLDLTEGIYAMFTGPHYETVAEAHMAAKLGADALGMSTVLEAIAVREAGMRLMALSTVTAHEAEGEVIDPDEVIAVAEQAAGAIGPAVLETIKAALRGEI